MADIGKARNALVKRILEGPGKAAPSQRSEAFDNNLTGPAAMLIDKVAKHAYRVTGGDISAATNSGLSEDQVFEIVVCAAIGQATRQFDAALAALDAASGKV